MKQGNALWIASHCWTDSRREIYIQKLNQHIEISVLGACSKVGQDTKESNFEILLKLKLENV